MYFQRLATQEIKVQSENKKIKALNNIKMDQERRLKKLQDEKEEFVFKAELIEAHVDDVEAIISILHMML